jgi:hypothetical protein
MWIRGFGTIDEDTGEALLLIDMLLDDLFAESRYPAQVALFALLGAIRHLKITGRVCR